MARKAGTSFVTIRTEGGVLPPDLLQRIRANDKDLDGLSPDAYHLAKGERLNEEATRSWNRLTGAWAGFQEARAKLAAGVPDAALTRDRWLLILFQELGYGRLPVARDLDRDGKSYPISHLWQRVPIHLVGFATDLDHRTAGKAGAATRSPHSLVQEFLNHSPDHLWGFVSNGLQLRILRDNRSLTRQAYVEFDLEAMMEGKVFADFVLVWLVAHQSRVEGEPPETCWLERWSHIAAQQGTRVLEDLRKGVQGAIESLGRGFLAHPANKDLKASLRSGDLSTQDYYREVLRMVYRLLFLFVAEDRSLLLDPQGSASARDLFTRHYSTQRLRRLSERRRGTAHADQHHGLRVVMGKLGSAGGSPELALPGLGSDIWSTRACPYLAQAEIANRDLLEAVRSLAFTEQGKLLRVVDYRNLGAEELGSVYESLLELHPRVNVDGPEFTLDVAAGSERKTTGSYYTPESLVQALLDTALDPVLDEAAGKPDPEKAILALKVCDPACGSGHFLIAAAHRMARRLAAVRTGDEEPSPAATRTALRDVVGHCLYGVDLNPMAVELCKVSLWMEALEPGKPLSFLDHRIQCGNSLLGTTPALLAKGIPDKAFEPIEGDDKVVVRELRRENGKQREGQSTLFAQFAAEPIALYDVLFDGLGAIDSMADDTLAAVEEKARRYERLTGSPEYRRRVLEADAWCAAFVWRKATGAPLAMTHDLLVELREDPEKVPVEVRTEVVRLARRYQFLHWHLAFPDVFRAPRDGREPESAAGWDGGFNVVLGNPPWERIKLQEKEWFAVRHPKIANAPNADGRRQMIKALRDEDHALSEEFLEARRQSEGESHLVRSSGRFPLCGRGDVNTYSVFAETKRLLMGPRGRVGAIVPSGVATDDTTKFFFQSLMDDKALESLYEFENEGFFPGTGSGHMNRFCLLTLRRVEREAKPAAFMFHGAKLEEMSDPDRVFELTEGEITLLNPNTRTCPIFRTRRDAEITKGIYRRVPVLIREGPPEVNPWGVSFLAMFHMSNDSGLFRTREQLEVDGWELAGNVFVHGGARRANTDLGGMILESMSPPAGMEFYLPLYEAKMIYHFDHRYGGYDLVEPGKRAHVLPEVPLQDHQDPRYSPLPFYWIPASEVGARLSSKWDRPWLLGWRDVTDARASARTVVAGVIPRVGVGHTSPLMFPTESAKRICGLLASFSSLAFDYVARQKVGGTHLTYHLLNQLPVLPPQSYDQPVSWSPGESLSSWILPRVLELTYTAQDLRGFAADLGYKGKPFPWDEDRRSQIRCELDAAFFHLYGINRHDVGYILDTFPIVKANDEKAHGEYRTKRVILELYDQMSPAGGSDTAYQTLLDPEPGVHPEADQCT